VESSEDGGDEPAVHNEQPALVTAWVDVRPALVRLPDIKTPFSLELAGSLGTASGTGEAPKAEPEHVRDDVQVPTRTMAPAAKPLDDQVAFAAELMPRVESKVQAEVAASPVAEAAPPVVEAAPSFAEAASPVVKAASPVAEAAPPVVKAALPVAEAAPPVVKAALPVIKAAPPVVEVASPVAEATSPVVEAAKGLPVSEPKIKVEALREQTQVKEVSEKPATERRSEGIRQRETVLENQSSAGEQHTESGESKPDSRRNRENEPTPAQPARHFQKTAEPVPGEKPRQREHASLTRETIHPFFHEAVKAQTAGAPEHKAEFAPAAKPSGSVMEQTWIRPEAPAPMPKPLREISLGLTSEQTRVGIQFRESESGTLQVSVRTPDSALAASLQRGLDELAASLSKQGMDAQFWTPADGQRPQVNASERGSDTGQQNFKDGQSSGNHGGSEANQQHKHNQRSHPEWLDALGAENEMDSSKGEEMPWPLTSQIFRAR
jgi:hypothetical protein